MRGPVAPILKAAPVGSTTSLTVVPAVTPPVEVSPVEPLALEPPLLLALPPLPPQAGQGQRHGRGHGEGKKLFAVHVMLLLFSMDLCRRRGAGPPQGTEYKKAGSAPKNEAASLPKLKW